jgi:hypothetical protein
MLVTLKAQEQGLTVYKVMWWVGKTDEIQERMFWSQEGAKTFIAEHFPHINLNTLIW